MIPTRESGITVSPFDGNEATMLTVAALHLELRHWQVRNGQAKFTRGIEDSQPDLTNLGPNYIEPGGNFFIATDNVDSSIVGFVGIKNEGEIDGDKQARLKRLAVMPDHQCRGIGSLLVGTAVDWAAGAGFRAIRLETGYFEKARRLYEKFGFVVVDTDPVNEDFLMELQIPR